MKPPYKMDSTPVYEVPFDNPDLVAKANKAGTIIVNKDRVRDKKLMDEAMSHEKQHLKDMQDGKLDYDNLSVTFKGKRYDRDSFDEGNENLPWEKRAYAAGRSRKEIDLTPKKDKLTGPPKASDSKKPLKFKLKGGSPFTALDENEVNMNENFGPALELDEIAEQLDDAVIAHGKQAKGIKKHIKEMQGMNKGTALHSPIKMWGAPAFEEGKDTDPSGGTEEEKIQENKSPYSGSTYGFDVASGKFMQRQKVDDTENFEVTAIDPSNYKGTSTDDSILNTSSYEQFKKDNPTTSNVDYDRSFKEGMQNVTDEYDKFKTHYNFYRDALKEKEGEGPLTIPYSGGNITFAPGQDFDALEGDTPLEKMRNIKFTYSNFDDKTGNEQPSFGGTKTLAELMNVDETERKASGFTNLQTAILDKARNERQAEFERTSQGLQDLKTNFPDLFTGTNTQKKLRAEQGDILQKQFLEAKKNAPHSNAVRRLEEQYKKDREALKTQVFPI